MHRLVRQLLGYLIAPLLLRWLSAPFMVALFGAITAAAGLAGVGFLDDRPRASGAQNPG